MTANSNEETKKTSTRGRKPQARNSSKKASVENQVHIEENARHIQENRQDIQNNTKMIHVLYSIIILLMVIIAGLAFWLWSVFSGTGWNMWEPQVWPWSTGEISRTWEWVIVTILDDARCNDCVTNDIQQQLAASPFLSDAEFVIQDFSETQVRELMEENNIATLPQVLFNTNDLWDGGQLSSNLFPLTNGQFRLEIGEAASFNPFAERSERGFLVMDLNILDQIKADSYANWNPDTPLAWIEYSDFGCTFCVRMHAEDNTVNNVLAAFPNTIHSRFQHMAFRNRDVPEAIECIAEQAWEQAFNTLISEWFNARVTTWNDVINLAQSENINFDTNEYEACLSDGQMQRKIENHMQIGQGVFWVQGTPWNVLINVETWEYEIISWAFPQATFEDAIQRLQ